MGAAHAQPHLFYPHPIYKTPEQEPSSYPPLPKPRPWNAPIVPAELGTYWHPEPDPYWPQLSEIDYLALSKYPSLPPHEYDYPFKGRLRIIELNSPEEVSRVCEAGWRRRGSLGNRAIAGCAIVNSFDPKADCVIVFVPYRPRIQIRHEIGHCNGWSGYHEGIRSTDKERGNSIPTGPTPPFLDEGPSIIARFLELGKRRLKEIEDK
jgi:hypothetical protein